MFRTSHEARLAHQVAGALDAAVLQMNKMKRQPVRVSSIPSGESS